MITARVSVDGKVSDEQMDPDGYPPAPGTTFAAAAGVWWCSGWKDRR